MKRPQNVTRLINEPFAAGVIYPTVLAAWTFFALTFGWPKGNPLIPIVVLVIGFVGTLVYDGYLRKEYEQPTPVARGNDGGVRRDADRTA